MLIHAFCPICLENIEQLGEICQQLYLQVCDHYFFTKHPLTLIEDDMTNEVFLSELKTMESHGFLISTESKNHEILVKPIMRIAKTRDDKYCIFCRGINKHA